MAGLTVLEGIPAREVVINFVVSKTLYFCGVAECYSMSACVLWIQCTEQRKMRRHTMLSRRDPSFPAFVCGRLSDLCGGWMPLQVEKGHPGPMLAEVASGCWPIEQLALYTVGTRSNNRPQRWACRKRWENHLQDCASSLHPNSCSRYQVVKFPVYYMWYFYRLNSNIAIQILDSLENWRRWRQSQKCCNHDARNSMIPHLTDHHKRRV